MREVWEFYKWTLSTDHESFVLFLMGLVLTAIFVISYIIATAIMFVTGGTLLGGLMVFAPFVAVFAPAAKKYKAQRDRT